MTREEMYVELYTGLVWAIASKYFIPGSELEDVVQEGMIGLLKAVRDYRPDAGSGFTHFAHICITRQIINAVNHAQTGKNMALNSACSLDEKIYDGEPFMEDPADIVVRREEIDAMRKILEEHLSRTEKKVAAEYLTGKSYAEIGTATGLSVKQVNNSLQRIRKKLVSVNKV